MKQKSLFIFFAISVFGLGSLHSLDQQSVPSQFIEGQHFLPYSMTKTPNGALKIDLLRKLKAFLGVEVFIESGTHLGSTTALAAEVFNEVHSIELSPELYSKAKLRFLQQNVNVSIYSGDSAEVLNALLFSIHKRTLFYLDGHYNGGNTAKGKKNTPILEELSAIRTAGRKDSVILIDDICNFQESKFPKRIASTPHEGYPNLKTLLEELSKINPHYQFCFLGNALLAFPASLDLRVSSVARACTIDRLSTVINFSEDTLQQAEMLIASSSGEEKEEILNCYALYAEFEQNHGWRSFFTFWYGLMLKQAGAGADARLLFNEAKENSIPGWRVDRFN